MDTLADAKTVPEGESALTLEPGFWVFPKKFYSVRFDAERVENVAGLAQTFCRIIPPDRWTREPLEDGNGNAFRRPDGCLVIIQSFITERCHVTTTEEALFSGTVQ